MGGGARMKRLCVLGALLMTGIASAHLLAVKVVRVQVGLFHPTVQALARVRGPDTVIIQAPYAAIMGPLLVRPGAPVAAGKIVARLFPEALGQVVQALTSKVAAAKIADRQARTLAHQGLVSAARAHTADAALAAARAALAAASVRLARGVVRAPFAGTVRYRAAPGAWLIAGAPVAAIDGAGGLYARAALTARAARVVSVGSVVRGLDFSGVLYALADRATSLGLVDAYIGGLSSRWRPGQVARVTIFGVPQKAYVIPRRALLYRQAQAQVFVVVDGHAQLRHVTIRGLTARKAYVQGLTREERVIVSQVTRLRAGTAVRISP